MPGLLVHKRGRVPCSMLQHIQAGQEDGTWSEEDAAQADFILSKVRIFAVVDPRYMVPAPTSAITMKQHVW